MRRILKSNKYIRIFIINVSWKSLKRKKYRKISKNFEYLFCVEGFSWFRICIRLFDRFNFRPSKHSHNPVVKSVKNNDHIANPVQKSHNPVANLSEKVMTLSQICQKKSWSCRKFVKKSHHPVANLSKKVMTLPQICQKKSWPRILVKSLTLFCN